jgi:subtilisin family serine protease
LYVDDILYGTQRPTVPDAGMFLMRTKTSDKFMFTSTVHTKRLMGGYDANELGFKGDGMTVAVVDTGGSRFHEQTPHLEFDNTLIGQIADHQGHGQWCASCVGGKFAEDYALSREAGKAVECEGFVPQARLVGIKSLGFGIGAGSTSSIIKGVELAMTKYEADVISMSLGGTCSVTSEQDDPFKAVMEGVVAKGVIPVVAAGNEGSGAKTVGSPGWIEEVLTVGAYDPISGAVAGFSSRGPTVDGRTKPDCTAPGVNIDSGILGMLDNAGDQKRNRYSPISGTSMATPHVSGLVTLMAECHLKTIGARLTVAEVKDMLRTLGGGKNNDDGWGPISWGMYRNWLRKIYGVEI